jgi:hypothetical protein
MGCIIHRRLARGVPEDGGAHWLVFGLIPQDLRCGTIGDRRNGYADCQPGSQKMPQQELPQRCC